MNFGLSEINACLDQRKMSFNTNPNKQAQEVIFPRKIEKPSYPPPNFNNDPVKQVLFQKHLDVYLYSKFDFREHLQNMFKKVVETHFVIHVALCNNCRIL